MVELTVSEKDAGQRFDKYLKKYLSVASSGFLYKMLRKKNITLNGKKAAGSEILDAGDLIRIFFSDETIARFHPEKEAKESRGTLYNFRGTVSSDVLSDAGIKILYEDGDLLFVSKPPGLLSQGDRSGTCSLAEIIDAYAFGSASLPKLDFEGKPQIAEKISEGTESSGVLFHAGPAHRLDRNTSGIILCGKSIRGMQFLSQCIREKSVRKHYLTVVCGTFEPDRLGLCTTWFTKDEKQNLVHLSGQPLTGGDLMKTVFSLRAQGDDYALMGAELITGKPHQIRAQLAFLGHPVAGDPKYGNRGVNARLRQSYGLKRQLLHAWKIIFPVEIENQYFRYLSGRCFTAPLPSDMLAVCGKLGLSEKGI